MAAAAAGGDGEAAVMRAEVAALRLRVQELERENQRLGKIASRCTCGSSKDDSAASSPVVSESLSSSKQEPQKNVKSHCRGCQVGVVSHCPKQLIALKIMYFGQRFYGFASEAHTEPTVESEIFKALERAKLLVGSRKESCYSRCGRTDKGVSATGQVISLFLRSNIKDAKLDVLDNKSEIDYVKVLNRILPHDIRVIGWCPVAGDFLAREYKYLFWKGDLNISEMQKAALKFIGEHDYRNFCKMDAANVSNFRRHITDFNISAYDQRSNYDELWAITIKGSAFLWHQVRCMVAVLFLIGQGLESPCIVDSLLDITKTPRKPQYKMASEIPLILRSCLFDEVNFMCSSEASQALIEHLKDEYHQYMLQAAIFCEALSCLCSPEPDPFEPRHKKRNHIPLMSRQTEPSYEERIAKVKTKSAGSV
uniref:Pseudouridine synthase I TruA alpha/beta domain-containing protein n=1 Tax=Oryza barthii TaxID=65489 RepID=A0A0D3FJ62_9ORYZ